MSGESTTNIEECNVISGVSGCVKRCDLTPRRMCRLLIAGNIDDRVKDVITDYCVMDSSQRKAALFRFLTVSMSVSIDYETVTYADLVSEFNRRIHTYRIEALTVCTMCGSHRLRVCADCYHDAAHEPGAVCGA